MTQIREATQESKVTRTEVLYCIEHEEMVRVGYADDCAAYHATQTGEGYSHCFFNLGYAYCAPPFEPPYDIPRDWADQDISQEEREQAELEESGLWLGGGG